MKQLQLFMVALLVTIGLPVTHATADIRVVASVPDLAAVAQAVVGNKGTVRTLALPTQDPHFVDARPSLALELARADALVLTGLDLEIGWLPTLQSGSRNSKIQFGATGYIDCSEYIDLMGIPVGKVDRSQGDLHPGGNPHYHFDPRRMAVLAQALADRFSAIDPDAASHYRANAESFSRTVARKQADWENRLATLKSQPIVSYHKSFIYLADWLKFEELDFVELKPGVPPSAAHAVALIRKIKDHSVPFILQEAWYPGRTTRILSERAGVPVLKLPGATNFPEQTYIEHIETVVSMIESALPNAEGKAP